jgi:hypothetical protein
MIIIMEEGKKRREYDDSIMVDGLGEIGLMWNEGADWN